MAQIKVFEPSSLDREILRRVSNEPGISLGELADQLFPHWSITYSREKARRLALLGLLRTDRGPGRRIYLYPVEADL